MSAEIVRFEGVDIVFGDRPERALPLIDAGRSRDEIRAETSQMLGVAGCSLDVREGEIVVLMGLSGSGKSTLLRAVNGLNRTTRGRALVRDADGAWVDPTRCGAPTLRRLRSTRVAMVFQQFALLPWRSVAENVGYGLELAGLPRAERDRRVATQLALVGLEGWGGRRVHELSGGMQQRVGLARAFATEAPILLMDEPYSALDPLIRASLQDELLGLQARLGCTILFVSHDLDEAIKLGSRIAIMEGGRIVQVGRPQEIVLAPATPYVAEFVAHVNPLGVLRAAEAMRPSPPWPAPEAAEFVLETPPHAAAAAATAAARASGVPCVRPETPLRSLLGVVRPGVRVAVVADGRVVGSVGVEEIMRALAR